MSEIQSRRPVETPAVAALEAELDRIRVLSFDELRALWRKMTQQNVPKALSRNLIARMIAYRIQEQTLGKLRYETRKLLDRLARGEAEPVRHLKVGTVMVREHQGILHEVMVLPGGFCWRDQTYASLSAIAQVITGTTWNGPRFFGLRGQNSSEAPTEPAAVSKRPSRYPARGSIRSVGGHSQGMEGRP